MRELWDAAGPRIDLASFLAETVVRLVLAAILGGVIGLERELARKPAGLRTNMFICFGAALYTILSFRYSLDTVDHNRISAQIIPGIGFIGAGSILHSKGNVTGVTTAATMFVVASVGMAVGGGEYLSAIFATLVILVALHFLGWLEARLNFKKIVMRYEVAGPDPERLFQNVNQVLEEGRVMMKTIEMGTGKGQHRLQFSVDTTHKVHQEIADKLRRSGNLEAVAALDQGEWG